MRPSLACSESDRVEEQQAAAENSALLGGEGEGGSVSDLGVTY